MIGKFFSATVLLMSIVAFNVEATPEIENFSGEVPVENAESLSVLTSENSGLNPGFTINPMKNSRPVLPGDPLPNMTAISAVVIEAETGHVIYAREAEKKMYPASTTKLMTLITAAEYGELDEIVTIGSNAYGAEGSTMWLENGEKISLRDLLYGMMLVSGNDAAIAVAEHIDGTTEKFAARMTGRARELGAKNTRFTNPNGLPDENHYTTAHDLAILAAHGYTLKSFAEIVGTKEKIVPGINAPRQLQNENQMLWLYRGCCGVKTGYTDAAGRCLVSAAKRDGILLIAVVLDSLYLWNDSVALLDYGFERVKSETVIKRGEKIKNIPVISGRRENVSVRATDEIVMPIFSDDSEAYKIETDIPKFLTAPVKKGEVVGKIGVICDGREIASTDLIATDDIERKSFFRWIFDGFINFVTGLFA